MPDPSAISGQRHPVRLQPCARRVALSIGGRNRQPDLTPRHACARHHPIRENRPSPTRRAGGARRSGHPGATGRPGARHGGGGGVHPPGVDHRPVPGPPAAGGRRDGGGLRRLRRGAGPQGGAQAPPADQGGLRGGPRPAPPRGPGHGPGLPSQRHRRPRRGHVPGPGLRGHGPGGGDHPQQVAEGRAPGLARRGAGVPGRRPRAEGGPRRRPGPPRLQAHQRAAGPGRARLRDRLRAGAAGVGRGGEARSGPCRWPWATTRSGDRA